MGLRLDTTCMQGVLADSKISCAILSSVDMVIGLALLFFIRTLTSPLKSLSITPPSIEICCDARLLRGAIRVYIVGGVAMLSPVGIGTISPGFIVYDDMLHTSYPIEPGVAREGILADGISR